MDTQNHALNEELVCPACRAKQAYSDQCRRCQADLQLYVKALRSLTLAKRQYSQAVHHGDHMSATMARDYLTWLIGDGDR